MAQQVKKKFIGNDQVDGSKILLEVGQTIRQKDGLGGEIDVIQSLEDSISSEQSRAEAAEAALDGRLDTAEGEIDQLQLDVVSNLSTAQAYTDQKIADLVDSAPALLDTLNELAAALGDDPNFVTTVTNLVAGVQSDIDQEILDRQSADTTLQNNIDAEESRALAAEGVLQGNIDVVSGDLAQEILDRQADVDAEETRALAAEAVLNGYIDGLGISITAIEANIIGIDDAKVNRAGDTMTGPLVIEDSVNPSNNITISSGNVQVTLDDGSNVFYNASHGIDVILEKDDTGNNGIYHYAEIAADGISLYNDDGNGGPQSAFIPTNDFQVTTKKYVDDEIAALSSGGVAAVQSELDATQVGAGLGTDGSYSTPVGTNYLGSAVSLKDADSKLDIQIKTVSDGLAQEILDRISDVDAEETRALAAELVLQGNIDDVAADLAQEVLDRQADVDAEESRALAAEGVLQGNINTVSSDLAQEILDRQADVDAEQSRAEAAESALDSRIDVLESVVWFKEKFVVNSTIISNGFVTLSHTPESNSMSAFVDRLAIHEGAGEDYSISGTTMTFLNELVNPGQQALAVGDTVYVKYQYKM